MAAKRLDLGGVIVFLIYVAIALTVLWLRPAISEFTGLPQGTILWIAVGAFLAVAIGSMGMRRKR